MISRICEEFQCTPDVAMQQDLNLCRQIMAMRQFVSLRQAEDMEIKAKGKRQVLNSQQRKALVTMERNAGL